MKRTSGPRNPVSPHPNGIQGYSFNPVEDLPVAEDDFSTHNVAGDYYEEPVFSSQAIYGFPHKTETYGPFSTSFLCPLLTAKDVILEV